MGREMVHLLAHFPDSANRSGPDGSQEPETPSPSPMWLAGAVVLEPSSSPQVH